MDLLQNHNISCPYCGEINALEIDCSSGSQDYIEDCQVCCRPMNVYISVDGHDVQLHVAHENE
jgi:hypothetical protein